MGLFQKRRTEPELPDYDLASFEPVIRASICTGEKVACMRDRESGKLHELMLIRTDEDLQRFCRAYRLEAKNVRTVY